MSSDKHLGEHSDGILETDKKIPGYFYLLFFGLIIWGVIFMAYYLFSGWSSSQEFTEKMAAHTGTAKTDIPLATPVPAATEIAVGQPTPAAAAPAASGTVNAAELYASNCAGCHGAAGTGGFGTDLTSASYEYGKDVAAVKASIATGRSGKMPAFSGRLSNAEIDALVDFVRKF